MNDERLLGAETLSEPIVIAEEIEVTRGEMTETIDAIQERLEPETLSAQAKDVAQYTIDEAKGAVRELADQASTAMREATIGRVEHMAMQTRDTADTVKTDLFETIKQNPIPAALAAIGIGWLWTHRATNGNGQSQYARQGMANWSYPASSMSAPYYGEYGGYGMARGGQESLGAEAQQKAGQVVGQAEERAGQMQQQVQQTAGQMQQQLEQTANQMQHQVQHTAHRVQRQAVGFWDTLEQNPVAVGALGMVLGGAVGLLIPETEQENELMGDTRDRVVGSVQEVAGQTLEKAQHVAADAAKTVADEAKSQGMAASSSSGSGRGSTSASSGSSSSASA
jgi:hypothetical protein